MHTFLCKNWRVKGAIFFYELAADSYKFHLFTKRRAVWFIFCLNEEIGKE